MSPALVPPTTRLHASWLASAAEWGEARQHGSSVWTAETLGVDLHDPRGFATWVEDLLLQADPAGERPADRVPATNRWVVEGDQYLGAIQLRHSLNPFLAEFGGHVGYGIRPSARGRGLAAFALRGMLPYAARLGLDEVLLTCDDDNPASFQTIESCGGQLVDVRQVDDEGEAAGYHQVLRRYRIPISATS